MKYTRTFFLQAAHLNGLGYAKLDSAKKSEMAGRYSEAILHLESALLEIHGHDFQIDVTLEGEPTTGTRQNWLVEDQDLLSLVMQWDNVNISMLPEFKNSSRRATTENMVDVLIEKIFSLVDSSVTVTVAIMETRNIVAQNSRRKA